MGVGFVSRRRKRGGGRLRWIAIYLSILSLGVLALTTSLLFGRHIKHAPQFPPLAAVTGPAVACLGDRVAAVQSGEFVAFHHRPGPAGVETIEEQLGEQVGRVRIDRRSGQGLLRGTCAKGAELAGQPYSATVAATAGDRPGADRVTAEGTLAVVGGEQLPLWILAADTPSDATGSRPEEDLSSSEVVARILLALAVVILASRALGVLLARVRQPRVVGEMLAGILLGPSLLGALLPGVTGYLFPGEVVSVLRVMAQVGLIFFMFLIGLELDVTLVRSSRHAALLVSHVSIVLPFALGSGLALVLYPLLGGGSFVGFALFIGAAMAITAFPVLARILSETGINRTRLGALAITCAAIDDITAWCILAVVVAIVNAAGPSEAIRTVLFAAVFVWGMLFLVRPALGRLATVYRTKGRVTPSLMAGLICGLLLSAWMTDAIGIHAIFGAFLFGVAIPRPGGLRVAVADRIEDVTLLFLLPIFFAVVGLSTKFGLLDERLHWAIAALVIAVAVVGKWGGSTFAARCLGVGWREASALGLLMNTRGLTEIVILTVGRSLGVISPAVFTIMVLMALVTTVMATPLLAWVYPARLIELESAEQPSETNGQGRSSSSEYRVVVGIDDPRSAAPLLELATSLHPHGYKPQVVLAHVTAPPGDDEMEANPGALEEAAERAGALMAPLAGQLLAAGYDAWVRTAVSADVGSELVRLAAAEDPQVVVLGEDRSLGETDGLRHGEPGGVVATAVERLPADVALLIRRAGHRRVGAHAQRTSVWGGGADALTVDDPAVMSR